MKYPMVALDELGVIQTGSTPSTTDDSLWGGGVPFVTPAELDQSEPVFITPRTLTDKGASQSRVIKKDAVMVCCIGSLGKVGLAGRDLVTNQQINSIQFDGNLVHPGYGYYACKRLKPRLSAIAPATTVPIVNKSKFGQLEIPLPPLAEQHRIAAILDKADTLRAKRREALTQLDRLAKSIFVEMFGDPAKNPKGWPVGALKELGKVSTGGTPPSALDGMFGGDIPFVTPGDLESNQPVRRTVTDAGAEQAGTVRAGATLVCCIGTIGKMGLTTVRCSFNQQLNAVDWFSEFIDDEYGFIVLQFFKPTIIAWGSSTTVPIIKKSSFEKLSIPVPPLALQQEFARHSSSVRKLGERFRKALEIESDLFAALQDRAFQGVL